MKKILFDRRGGVTPPLLFFFIIVLFPFPVSAEEEGRIHFLHALKSKQEGNYLQAESLLQKAVELEPQNADFHFELGNLYAERGNLTVARLEYEVVAMIDPFHLPAHYNLGLVYRDLGRMSEARDQFRKVLEIDPSNAKAQLQIGYTYQEEGFFDEARQAFQEAQDRDFTDQEPKRALEDLEHYEDVAERRSAQEFARGFERNPFRTANRPLYADPNHSSQLVQNQPSGQQALLQTGILLLQQLMAGRSETNADPGASN